MQFPLVAGSVLLGLYLLIKVFGKDAVNYCILVYIAVGGTTGIKELLKSFVPNISSLDENKMIDVTLKWFEI